MMKTIIDKPLSVFVCLSLGYCLPSQKEVRLFLFKREVIFKIKPTALVFIILR